MHYLSEREREDVQRKLAMMTHPVRLIFFGQSIGCETCADTERLLKDLPDLAPGLTVEPHNLVLDKDAAAIYAVDRAPAIAIVGDSDTGIRFLGAPVGHELTGLVDAIAAVSRRDSGLSPASRSKLAGLSTPIDIRVFSTPSCAYCPQAVSLAHRMAVESPFVTSTAVSVIEYPDLIQRFRVTGVPKIVIDGRVELLGAQPEDVFVDAVIEAATHVSAR